MYALVLAGGRGERLRPLTDDVPKPMISLHGKPLLEYQVAWLTAGGIEDIVFLAGYKWESIKDHFKDGSSHGFRAHYSIENADAPLGRGGAIRKGMAQLPQGADPIVVANGDIITDMPIADLLARYKLDRQRNRGHLATIMVVPYRSPYGIVEMNESGVVIGFREKVELPYWINGGVYLFSRGIETLLPELGDHELDTFPSLAAAETLAAHRFTGYWQSIDSFKDLGEAEERLFGAPSP